MSLLEGYLLKQGEKGKSIIINQWKKRWFEVRTGNGLPGRKPHLFYFEKQYDNKEKGKIDLSTLISVTISSDELLGRSDNYEFNLITHKRTYKLRATNEDELSIWVEGLREISMGGTPKRKITDIKTERRKSTFQIGTGRRASMMSTQSSPNLDLNLSSSSEGVKEEENSANKYSRKTEVITATDIEKLREDIKEEDRKRDKVKEKVKTKREEINETSKDIKNKLTSPSPSSNFFFPKLPDDMATTPLADKQLFLEQDEHQKAIIAKYEEKLQALRKQNQQLQSIIDNQNKEMAEGDDYDRKRREAELAALKDKLQHEVKFRKDLQRQLNDTKEELKNLKLSLHSVHKIPNINPSSSHLTTSSNPNLLHNHHQHQRQLQQKNNNNNNNSLDDDSKLKMLEKTLSVPNLSSSNSFPKVPPLPNQHSPSSTVNLSLDSFNFEDIVDVTEEIHRERKDLNSNQPLPSNTQSRPMKWQLDHTVTKCNLCSANFTFFTRKHHCRSCGMIFCGACSNFSARIAMSQVKPPSLQRVCKTCFVQLRGNRQSPDQSSSNSSQRSQITGSDPRRSASMVF